MKSYITARQIFILTTFEDQLQISTIQLFLLDEYQQIAVRFSRESLKNSID